MVLFMDMAEYNYRGVNCMRRWIIMYLTVLSVALLVVVKCDRTITAVAENQPVIRKYCIVLDAGHGGVDGGAVSCTGIRESDINLEITIRLNDLFHLLGYQTKMIRHGDESLHSNAETIAQKKISDLKMRTKIVNETENAVLISIHQNNFTDSRYSGAQVFYNTRTGSEGLAKMIQDNFVQSLNHDSKRKIQRSKGVYIMDHVSTTAVLVECGFLSNAEEEAKLRTDEYQKKICCVVASATSTFLSNS